MQTDSERSVSLIVPLPITVLVCMSDDVSVYGDTFLRAPFLRNRVRLLLFLSWESLCAEPFFSSVLSSHQTHFTFYLSREMY